MPFDPSSWYHCYIKLPGDVSCRLIQPKLAQTASNQLPALKHI